MDSKDDDKSFRKIVNRFPEIVRSKLFASYFIDYGGNYNVVPRYVFDLSKYDEKERDCIRGWVGIVLRGRENFSSENYSNYFSTEEKERFETCLSMVGIILEEYYKNNGLLLKEYYTNNE